jgi:hypothetical protein
LALIIERVYLHLFGEPVLFGEESEELSTGAVLEGEEEFLLILE